MWMSENSSVGSCFSLPGDSSRNFFVSRRTVLFQAATHPFFVYAKTSVSVIGQNGVSLSAKACSAQSMEPNRSSFTYITNELWDENI